MLPRIRERIANEVRQRVGGGNPFQVNFDNNNDNNNNNNNNGDINNNNDQRQEQGQQQQQPQQQLQQRAPNRNPIVPNLHEQNNARQAAEDNSANNQQPQQPQLVRPEDLYLGCSTRVRRELLRINEWDRMIAVKDVWTKQVAEAPTRQDLEDLQQQQNENGNGNDDGGGANNNNNNNNGNNDPILMQFLNANNNNNNGDGANNTENSDHDIREIMDLNIKKQRFRPAFYKVQFFNPTYASNLSVMKLFHKRHAGNPKLAAQQFCRYWDLKLLYFGLEQLCQPLSLKHSLSSQDKACLHNGCMQLTRDEHGRTVLVLLPSLVTVEQANGPPKQTPMEVDGEENAVEEDESSKLVCPHLVRALWYLVFRALQDKGDTNLVILLLGQDTNDLFGKTILHCTSVLREALPFHVMALHYLDGPGMSTLEEEDNANDPAATGPRNPNNIHHPDNFLWAQQDNQDMHGFAGGLEQVAEWGGAVQVPDDHQNQAPEQDLNMLPGAQDAEQQRRMLEKSKSSLEHLEDRVGRNVRLRLRFHNLFQLQLEDLARNNDDNDNANQGDDPDKEDPFRVLRKRLVEFGIPNLLLNSDGTLIMHNPIDATSKRFFFTKAEHSLSSNLILPTSQDILLGKGRPYQEHPGNIALNDVIDKHRSHYTSCKSRSEKTAMSQSILETIQNQGGRFLIKKSKDDDLWVVAPPAKARDKIAHSFRLPRKHLKEAMDKAKQKKEQEETAAAGVAAENLIPPQPQQGQLAAVPLPPNGQPIVGGLANAHASV